MAQRLHQVEENPETLEELWAGLGETAKKVRRRDKTPTYMSVPVDQIVVDERYQRRLKQTSLDKMAARGWDNVAAETVTLNMREDGELLCINGQHRVLLARQLGKREIDCRVFDGLTYQEEADAFSRINVERAAIQVIDRFRADIEAEKPEALLIKQITEDVGYEINLRDYNASPDRIVAIDALQSIYRWGGAEGLREVLTITKRLWPDEKGAVAGVFLKAVYAFVHRHRRQIDWDRFYETFERLSLGQIERAANKRRSEDNSISPGPARYLAFLDLYNGKLRKGKLIPKLATAMTADWAPSMAVLTEDLVYEIRVRALYLEKRPSLTRDLALEYGVSRETMGAVLRGSTWKEVTVDPLNIRPEHQHWAASRGERVD